MESSGGMALGDEGFGRYGSGRWKLRKAWLREMEASGVMAPGGDYSEAWKSENGIREAWAHRHGLAEPRGHRGSLTTTPIVAPSEGGQRSSQACGSFGAGLLTVPGLLLMAYGP